MAEPKPVRKEKRFWIWALIIVLAAVAIYLALGSPAGPEPQTTTEPVSSRSQ